MDTEIEKKEDMMGWGLFFHPDLIRGTSLGSKMKEYNFFSYETAEALHLSEKEKQILFDCVQKIEQELQENIDDHSQNLIVSNIELLLSYCSRYYGRQFITRKNTNFDVVVQVEQLLKAYFQSDALKQKGLPTVKYLAEQVHLSPNYLSDLLKKETGKNAQDHIHYQLIEEAKIVLLHSNSTVSEVAYSLGFEYPQYFSKLFKQKTGATPLEFRNLKSTLATLFYATVFLLTGCGRIDNKTGLTDQQDTYYGSLVDTILNHSQIKFKHTKKDDIIFYYESDPFFDNNIDNLTKEAIISRNHCVSLLGNKRASYDLKVIYFNDREKLRPYLHMAPKGYALPDAYTLLIATNDSIRAYHAHELMHIISINQFGGYAVAPADWIQEGIAVYADNPCMNYPIHAIAANLLYTNKLAALDSLFYEFRTLPDMAGYMQAGSVVQFFLEKYGLDKFEMLWRKGVNNIEQIIFKSKTDFEKEYHRFLRHTYPQQPEINWTLLNDKGCG